MPRSTNEWLRCLVACRGLALSSLLALAGGHLLADPEAIADRAWSTETSVSAVAQQHQVSGLEARVNALSTALELDAAQKAAVRKLLEWQREQIRRVWDEPAVPPGYRVSAVHAISDDTAERIRGLLNEEQRRRYKLPRQPHPAATGEGQRTLGDWLSAMTPYGGRSGASASSHPDADTIGVTD